MAPSVDASRAGLIAGVCATAGLLLGVGLAVVVAGSAGPLSSVWPDGVALGAGVLLVGFGSLPFLGVEPSARLIGGIAAVWLVAGVAGVWLSAGEQAGRSPLRISVHEFADAWSGRPSQLIATACALAVAAWAIGEVTGRLSIHPGVVAGMAGIGVVAVAVAGHSGQHELGPVVVGVHAVAAAWWCGALAALALTVRGRAGWAQALPRFSSWALWAVVALAASGVIAAVMNMDLFGAQGFSAVWRSGYGRVVLAKTVVLLALLFVAAVHRRRWVPRAAGHRSTVDESLRRAALEIALMAVAVGLAAGLAGTAPQG
ncbi:CopD family protein [Gordonia sp. X0973]|uniref:CopD family protein n=1 Tax=Gordonia sp. X0973 TaxID=2742602 RepID=UPI000F5426F1|nr:CopD family protein [Gordonia sp. X0973]QKT06342.1 CopD family protein [Gordonia sp. X0973]